MSTFTINFTNNSHSSGNFCVFQQDPSNPSPYVFPLAWRVERGFPQSHVAISWNTDYSFVWGYTGTLMPGVAFQAGENVPAGLTNDNEITFTNRGGRYQFVDRRTGYQQGALTIMADPTTAINDASVGIGLSGAPSFAVQAQPNMVFRFSSRVEYWVTFSQVTQGEVLDRHRVDAVKVDFPHGISTMNATLNADNTWTITQGRG
jgi:hypothetical protein